MKNNFVKGSIVFAALLIAVMAMSSLLSPGINAAKTDIDYGEFLNMVRAQSILRVNITETQSELVGLTKNTAISDKAFPGKYDFKVTLPADYYKDISAVVAAQMGKGADQIDSTQWGFDITYQPEPKASIWSLILPNLILLGLMAGILVLFMRQMQGANNKAMSFGKSRAQMAEAKDKTVTFKDVAGAEEEKEELAEIVEFLRNPRKFTDLGARIPKGVLLVGPPGTGKTFLAKAVAGEAGSPFFSISGSDFVELYVGVGASRVRDLFDKAKRNAPSIIFIDEIDAVGRHRGAGLGGGHDEREQTLNQLLVEMDGFSTNEGIIIIAATNRADILDPALLRAGRFDRQITVGYPDAKAREAVLRIHARKKPLADDADLAEIAKMTPWFTPADLENIMNEAAILAARRNRRDISMAEIVESINRVELGPEKRSRKMIENDRKIVATHEAGHAVVAHLLPHCDSVKEVSIISRGAAGGYTAVAPDEETYFTSRAKLMDNLAFYLGGQVAERELLGDVTTGSTSDLQRASEVARRMITEYGMNEQIGPVYLSSGREVFVGRDFGHAREFSEQLTAQIDEQVKKTLEEAQSRATNLLRTHRAKLEQVVEAVLEREKLTAKQFRAIMDGGEPDGPPAKSAPGGIQLDPVPAM